MLHVPDSEIGLSAECLQSVSMRRKIKCPLCGQKSLWLSEVDDAGSGWDRQPQADLRMHALAVALYLDANPEAYAHEFEQVLALPL